MAQSIIQTDERQDPPSRGFGVYFQVIAAAARQALPSAQRAHSPPHAPANTTVMLEKPSPSILCFISMGAVKRVDWGPSLPARGPAAWP